MSSSVVTTQLPIFSTKSKIGFFARKFGILPFAHRRVRADLNIPDPLEERLSARNFVEKMGS